MVANLANRIMGRTRKPQSSGPLWNAQLQRSWLPSSIHTPVKKTAAWADRPSYALPIIWRWTKWKPSRCNPSCHRKRVKDGVYRLLRRQKTTWHAPADHHRWICRGGTILGIAMVGNHGEWGFVWFCDIRKVALHHRDEIKPFQL